MRNLIYMLLLSVLFFATPAVAGPGPGPGHGHSHGSISGKDAMSKAAKEVQRLVKAGKIDGSWSKINAADAEQKEYGNGPEWVVTFRNDQAGDTEEQMLYIFFTLDGNYIAANYTGE